MDDVQRAYDRRSADYAELLGSMDAVHPADRALVDYWSGFITGRVLDVGCGPGHWTGYLHQRGLAIGGLDLSPRFVDHARAAFPHLKFDVGSRLFAARGDGERRVAGVERLVVLL